MNLNVSVNSHNKIEKKFLNKDAIIRNVSYILPIFGLILITLILGILSKGLLFSTYNFDTIIRDTTPILIVSLGAVFVYSLGAMDISIGSVIATGGMLSILVMNNTKSIWLGILTSMIIAVVVALVIGTISIRFNLMPIMTSMCFMLIGRGIVLMITTKIGGTAVKTVVDVSIFKNTYFQIGSMIVLAIIFASIYNFTRIGKNAKAIGTNKVCSMQCGIKVAKYFVLSYLMLGLSVGIASMFVLSTTSSVSRSTGLGFEMDIMIALIMGGMPLAGGMKSKISGAIIGPFTYIILKNGLLLTSFIDLNQIDVVKAIIFFIIISLTCRQKSNVLPT